MILPVSLLCLGMLLAFHPTILSGFARMQTDEGDTLFNNYVFEHGYRWLRGMEGHRSFWDAPFYFPATNVAAYSDVGLGAGPVYWLLRLAGIDEILSFQLWMMAALALNQLSMTALLRRGFGAGPAGAAFGGFLFAFASTRLVQLGHQQLLPQFLGIWALHGLIRAYREPARGKSAAWLAASAVFFAAQLYASYYLGWFLGLGLAVTAAWALLLSGTRGQVLGFARRNLPGLALAAGVLGACLFPLGRHYLAAAREVGFRTIHEVAEPKIQSWLYLGERNWLYAWQERIRVFEIVSGAEARIGIGWLTLGLVIAGFRGLRPKSPWYPVLILASVSVIAMTTRFYKQVYLWPFLFPVIPGAPAVRALTRVALLLLIPAAVGAAHFVDSRAARGGRWTWLLPLLCAFSALEQANTSDSFGIAPWRARVEAVRASVAPRCRAFYWSAARDEGEYKPQIDAMWASLMTAPREVPTLNGYSGNQPPGWRGHVTDLGERRAWLDGWVRDRGLDPASTCWVGAGS